MTTIGFDLDMTLIDSRPGVSATLDRIAEESGHPIDSALAASRLGPPLQWELAHWVPQDEIDHWVERYRSLYPETALPVVEAMPGAHQAIAAANALGRSLLITAKHRPNAVLHAERLGLDVGEVFGDAWREAKGVVLRDQGAAAYVGDHEHDVVAAQAAGIPAITVSTGGTTAEQLRAAGADVVIESLLDFDDALHEVGLTRR